MRDPHRIPVVLAKLEQTWGRYPDLRLGQLLTVATEHTKVDLFYVEDEVLYDGLDNLMEKLSDSG